MESPKRLARGLKDISPLFASPERAQVKAPARVQILSVSSPPDDEDSLLLNTYFASRLASQERPCSLISLLSRSANLCPWNSKFKKTESFGKHIQRHSLFWDELKDILAADPGSAARISQDRSVFLDFEYRHLLYYPKLLALLDKWALLLKPTAESMTEGYKMIKAGLAFNPFLECFVLIEAKANPSFDSSIFEKFAILVSKHLKTNLGWLGWLDLSDPDHFFAAELNVEQLQYQPANARLSVEKLTLAGWLESNGKIAETAPHGEKGAE